MKLTGSNYYGTKANQQYFSVSQFKDFLKCPATAMAKLRGEYEPERGRALLLGSYVDEALTGTAKSFERFCEENHEELFQKRGDKKYADIIQADEAIAKVKAQPTIVEYLTGEKQKIFTGTIAGVPMKGKLDVYKKGERIVDLKYVASLRSPNIFENVVDYWNYTLQGAIYVELVRQTTGKELPFYLVLITKEKPVHMAIVELDPIDMYGELEKAKALLPKYQAIKNGELPADRCEEYNCPFCTETKVIAGPIPVSLLARSRREIDAMNGVI